MSTTCRVSVGRLRAGWTAAAVERGCLPGACLDPLQEGPTELGDRTFHGAAGHLADAGEGAGGGPRSLQALLAGGLRIQGGGRRVPEVAQPGGPPVDRRARLGVPGLARAGERLERTERLVIGGPVGGELLGSLTALERGPSGRIPGARGSAPAPSAGERSRSPRARWPARQGPDKATDRGGLPRFIFARRESRARTARDPGTRRGEGARQTATAVSPRRGLRRPSIEKTRRRPTLPRAVSPAEYHRLWRA